MAIDKYRIMSQDL